MKTTLRRIKKHRPCQKGWDLLISNVDNNLDRELTIREILKSNGIKDAIWALECIDDQKSVRLFYADVAESVLNIFEEKYPNDKRPRLAIKAARDFTNGLIAKEELRKACSAANAATNAAAYTACSAAYTANAATNDTAYSAADAANAAAYYAAYVAAYAAYDAAWDAAYDADAAWDAAEQNKWKEIEDLLLKYL